MRPSASVTGARLRSLAVKMAALSMTLVSGATDKVPFVIPRRASALLNLKL